MTSTTTTVAVNPAAQATFIKDFGAFLADEAGIGLQPCGMTDEGEIRYGRVEEEAEPLEKVFLIDGSPRQERVGGVDIPELKDRVGQVSEGSPFMNEVFALQKAIEVPLRPLMVGMGEKGDQDAEMGAALQKRVALYGHLNAREFLARHYGRGGPESSRIIRIVAEDIAAVAQRLEAGEGNYMPNVFFLNSAVLFAALDEAVPNGLAVDNFFEAAKSLYIQKVFVGAAILAEKAVEVAGRESSKPLSIERSNVLHNFIADSWHRSLEADPSGETFGFRLYRGMHSAWNVQDKAVMGKFLKIASHLSLAEAGFEKAAHDFMRRGWYGAQRYPMTDKHWFVVGDMINRAVAIWIANGMDERTIEKAVRFSQQADKYCDAMKVAENYGSPKD
jgi:hypothetical protein